MASYEELSNISEQPTFGSLQDKIRVAVVINAVTLLDLPTPTAKQIEWAQAALSAPADTVNTITFYVVGANAANTIDQILSATDAGVQANVDAAVESITSV